MAKKILCDGCGKEIPPFNPEGPPFGDGDGRTRKALLQLGLHCVEWDLCDRCLGNAASALATALPSKPREQWLAIVCPASMSHADGLPSAGPAQNGSRG